MNSRTMTARTTLKFRTVLGFALGILATSCRVDTIPSPDEEDAGCDACSIEPDAAVVEPDAAMPDQDAAMPDQDAAMPDQDAAMPDQDAAMPDQDAAMPDQDAAMPDQDAAMPDQDAGDGGSDDGGCNGPCLPNYPNGTMCNSSTDCASGFCVDSVCCDSACTGVCRSCIANTKGSGSDGTCGTINPGTDPDNECLGVCNLQGLCGGVPASAYCQTAADCASGFCVNGVCCAVSSCSPVDSCHVAICSPETGTCTDIPRMCPSGLCSNDLCPGQCTGKLGLPGERVIFGPAKSGAIMGVAIGDIDNDGDADVLANYYENVFLQGEVGQIGVLRNQGTGTFGAWEKRAGLYGSIFLLADMNNDGLLDAVHGAYLDPKILIQLNDGTGLFTVPVNVSLSPAISGSLRKIVTVDLNNDGYRDIIVNGWSSGQVFTSLSASGTSFGTPINAGITVTASDDFEAADLNADGKADLVYTSYLTNNINVRLGMGNGSFGAATSYSVAALGSLELRDINADGKTDIIASNGANTAVRLNLGNGSFGAEAMYPGGSANLADLNGDGSIDIMGATTLFNNGSGSFVPQNRDYVPYEDAGVGDVNGDGLADLARMTLGGGAVTIQRNQGNGLFLRPYLPFDFTADDRDRTVFVDLNGDNFVDLATIEPLAGQIGVRLNLGNATFAPSVGYSAGLPSNSSAVIEGVDMNGDGRMDLVASVGTKVLVYLNNGGGVMAPVVEYVGGAMNGPCFTIGDFNADARPDVARLVQGSSNNKLEVMLNQGNGTLAPGVHFANVNNTNKDLVAADLNGDGYSDFVVHGTFENVSIFMNNTMGAAVFQPQPIDAFGFSIDGIAVGDINGDNFTDVAFSSPSYATVPAGRASLNDGHGVFRVGPFVGYGITDIVDVDGNGLNDFISYRSGVLCVGLNGGVATGGCYETLGGPGDVVDIDGDGALEIVTPQGALHKITCFP